ncbi:uncharacterized protein [Dermacentor albipictus]
MSQVQMARAAAVAVASCPDARDCPMCDYVATARSSLIIHMRKHTGERPYRCHLCPAAFAKSSDRSRHFRTHQLHKPFNCGSCGKSFAQRRRDLQSWTCRHASTPRLAPDTSASCVTLPRRSLTTYVLTCTHITLGRPASMPSLDNIGSAWSAATSRRDKQNWCLIVVYHRGQGALVQDVQLCHQELLQHGGTPADTHRLLSIMVSTVVPVACVSAWPCAILPAVCLRDHSQLEYDHAPAYPYGRAPLSVPPVPERICPERQPQATRAHPHRRAPLLLRVLRCILFAEVGPLQSHAPAHRREAIQM